MKWEGELLADLGGWLADTAGEAAPHAAIGFAANAEPLRAGPVLLFKFAVRAGCHTDIIH